MKRRWWWSWSSSLAVHAVVFGVLLLGPKTPVAPEVARPLSFVPIELPPPRQIPTERVEPEAERTPAPASAPRLRPHQQQRAAAAPPAAAAPTEALADTTPVALRLGGVRLSNSGFVLGAVAGAGFGGAAAPIPKAEPARVARTVPEPPAPKVASLADLSVRPVPPALDTRLERSYPAEFRRRGLEGEALVRLLLSEGGRVLDVRPLSSSHPEFARACQETLSGTIWSAPRDRQGAAVRVTLDYRCRFRVAL